MFENILPDRIISIRIDLSVTAGMVARADVTVNKYVHSGYESEHVLRIARIFEYAIRVPGGENETRQWSQSAVKDLGNNAPVEFADTEPGAREVEAIFDRIEDAVVH